MTREIAPETLIDGRYRILSRIGSGGMADVYCAEDSQLGRNVAVKLLHRRFAEDEQFVERFRREAQSAAGLQHPNVVNVYDRGEWDGTYYIAMEYLDGRTLKQLIREEAPVAPLRAIELTLQILRAARFAHQRGIVHRDLKPHNAIVDAEDRLKVTDFGIARAGASDMTETGSIMGTAQYLSPEQAQGHPVGPASDLYSIGVVLYELLTGRVPFEADSAVTIALKHVSEMPVPPGQLVPLPPALDMVVQQALAKDPVHRFADADAFMTALEHARAEIEAAPAGEHTAAFSAPAAVWVPPDNPYPDDTPRDRRRFPFAALIIALALLGGGLAAFLVTRPAKTEIPNVIGASIEAGATVLDNAGFDVNVERVTKADVPRDRIFKQDPGPGTKAEKGSAVTIFVSSGPPEVLVPPVVGKGRRTARKELLKAGFKKIRVVEENSDTIAHDRVISVLPSAGQEVPADTEIVLTVSSGREKVTVPKLVGASREDALAALDRLGLNAKITEKESEDADPGTVLEQAPAPGSEAEKGSDVALVVAKQPESVQVPDVVGLDQSEAANRLDDAGLRVLFQDQAVDRPSEDGTVVAQKPSAGRRVKRGSRVTIVVGRFELPQNPDGTTTTP